MSAPNFNFERRCILVPGKDIEYGNAPYADTPFDSDRSYGSYYLEKYKDDFNLVAIVITNGYYCDACLDIRDREDRADELRDYLEYYANRYREDLVNDICYYLGVSKRFVLRHLKGCDSRHKDYRYELSRAFDAMIEDARDMEVERANKVLDKIKKSYGYQELACDGVFSNGEAIYHAI